MSEFRLGKDLSTYDVILPQITFDELILTLHCNIPKDKITPEAALRELRKILEINTEDMWFLVDKNMDKIIQYSKENYRDE